MTPDDLPRLQELIERTTNPLIKKEAEEALLAVIKGIRHGAELLPRQHTALHLRKELVFYTALIVGAIGALVAIAMVAAGRLSAKPATIGTVLGAAALYVGKKALGLGEKKKAD